MHTDEQVEFINEANHPENYIIGNTCKLGFSVSLRIIALIIHNLFESLVNNKIKEGKMYIKIYIRITSSQNHQFASQNQWFPSESLFSQYMIGKKIVSSEIAAHET